MIAGGQHRDLGCHIAYRNQGAPRPGRHREHLLRIGAHRRAAAEAAADTARKTFEEGVLAESLPTVTVTKTEIAAGLGVLTAFVKAGLLAMDYAVFLLINMVLSKLNCPEVSIKACRLTESF